MKKNLNLPPRPMNSVMATTRKRISLLVLTVFAVFFNFALRAQDQPAQPDPGGCTDACLGNALNISTGYNQSTSTYNTPLALESNWTLVGIPSTASITLPAPCYDIVPYPAWSSNPNAQWVSPYQNSAYNVNNWPQSVGAYEFEKCFCICRQTTVNIKFDMLVDDGGEVFLDGVSIATAYSGYQFQWPNRLQFNQNFTLNEGRHCLTVKLYNVSSVAMGFSLEGYVTGANLLTSACCNPTASICGIKLQDLNCDGRVDPSVDPGLPNWTIELYDNLGNYLGSALTDPQGNYCFTGLRPGTYIVKEVNQPGWTQTYPAGGAGYTLTLNAGDVGSAIFGNCGNIEPQRCDFRLAFDGNIDRCGINFTPVITGMPFGYSVVSYNWNFGDGTSSNLYNGIHYYSATGVYTLCLTVTIFNGEECCTKTYCKDIRIEKPCKEGCDFEAGIKITYSPEECEYTFTADVTFTGLPITAYYWDYGDGSTGTGPVTTHQYATGGSYVVCLYLFAQKDEDCCWRKFCKEIRVEDCRPRRMLEDNSQGSVTPTKPNDTNIKNGIVLDQNSPNPFAESTIISYEIPATAKTAQLRITNLNGIVVKTMDIQSKGKGQVVVFGTDLDKGMYMYNLIVDGKVSQSKRMVKN